MIKTFEGWLRDRSVLSEADTRYSVEVNFRTRIDDVLKAAAKITLGYASAALKNADYHVKQLFEEEPFRIMVSSRNWDDGEWVVVVSWHTKDKQYVISKGFYNKDRKTVSVQASKHCPGENGAELAAEVKNMFHGLKDQPDRHVEKLKKVPLKRGPK
jgi:hypothetical protein